METRLKQDDKEIKESPLKTLAKLLEGVAVPVITCPDCHQTLSCCEHVCPVRPDLWKWQSAAPVEGKDATIAPLRETISAQAEQIKNWERRRDEVLIDLGVVSAEKEKAEATISTLQEDLTLLAEKVVIERAESNALRAENQELRQVVKHYYGEHQNWGGDPRNYCSCETCVEAARILEPQPVAPDQPTMRIAR